MHKIVKMQVIPVELNLTKHEKLIDMVSNSTLLLNFKNLLFNTFWFSVMKEYSQLSKNILKYSFLFQLHICVRPNFLYTHQAKQHTRAEMRIQLSSIKPALDL